MKNRKNRTSASKTQQGTEPEHQTVADASDGQQTKGDDREDLEPGKEESEEESKRSDVGFDLDRLRLPQNFNEIVGVKRRLVSLSVRKPHRQEFVRVHPDPEYRLETALLTLEDERDGAYLLAPELWDVYSAEIKPKMLVLVTTRQGATFLWALRLPGPDGRFDLWGQSALEAADIATERWISVRSNMQSQAYEVWEAIDDLGDPEWAEITFQEAIELAFKDRYIDDVDHPVLKRLRGEL